MENSTAWLSSGKDNERLVCIESVAPLKEKYTAIGQACLRRGFYDSHLMGKIAHTAESCLLRAGALPDMPHVDLYEAGELGVGRHESANSVRFGYLLMGDSPSHISHQELVAMKEMSYGKTVHEVKAMAAVRAAGCRTLETLAVLRCAGDKAAHITRYMPDSMTLDTVLWRSDSTNDQRETAAYRAGVSLGELHDVCGMTHGDFQPKNIAYCPADDSSIHFDLDGALSWHAQTQTERARNMMDDVETFAAYQTQRLDKVAILAFIDGYSDSASGQLNFSLSRDELLQSLESTDLCPLARF